jgi:hypothetical protein
MCENNDIHRELKSLFTRTNVLAQSFKHCAIQAKVKQFHSNCICMYDIALWSNFSVIVLNKLASSFIKCMKLFVLFSKYCSATN